jgi:hypothetical protein
MSVAKQCEGYNRSGTQCRDEAWANGLCPWHLGLGRQDRRFIRASQKARKRLSRRPESRLLAAVFLAALRRK